MKILRQGQISRVVIGALIGVAHIGAGCGGDDVEPDAAVIYDAAPELGTLSLDWAVMNGPNALPCDQVGGLNVRVTATPQAGGFGVTDAFSCASGQGATMPFAAGVYNVEVALVTSGNRLLVPPETLQSVGVLTDQDTSLGSYVFEVVPSGHVDFTIDAQSAAGNCALEADGGAGITAFLIEYRNSLNECVPSTFVIGDGVNQTGGTYVSDCAGSQYVCIDKDQMVRGQDVPSGAGGLYIAGYRGADECYTRNPQFPVSGNGLVTELSPQALSPVGVCVPAP